MTDRELLVEVNTKLTSLCGQFCQTRKENREDHERIWGFLERNSKTMDDKIDKKLPAKIFYWSVPFIIIGLLGLAGYAGNTNYRLGKTEKAIEIHLDEKNKIEDTDINKNKIVDKQFIKNLGE